MAQPGVESKGLFRFNRLAQPLHCEFDIERLQGAPTLDFRLISILRVALEIILGPLRGGRVHHGEFLTDEGILGHGRYLGAGIAQNNPYASMELFYPHLAITR
jgi:hypothetical protein